MHLNGFWENMLESAKINDAAIRNFIMNSEIRYALNGDMREQIAK